MGKQQLSDMASSASEASLFPIFNTSFDGEDTHQSVPVNLDPPDGAFEFFERNNIGLPQLLQIAWAVLLKSYIGTDRPLFHYFDKQKSTSQRHGTICSLDLEEDREISVLARSVVYRNGVLLRDEEKRLGTAILWDCPDMAHWVCLAFQQIIESSADETYSSASVLQRGFRETPEIHRCGIGILPCRKIKHFMQRVP